MVLYSSFSKVLLAILFLAVPFNSWAFGHSRSRQSSPPIQYRDCEGQDSFPVDSNYSANAQGEYCMVRNQSGGSYNFSVDGVKQYSADPSILKIGDWYYETGTTDSLNNWNFAIYRSKDLVHWENHMLMFSPDQANGQTFCNLWAPQLYINPQTPGVVSVVLTATENGPSRICSRPDSTSFISIFRTSMAVSDFAATAAYFPLPVGYAYQNATATGHPIPSTKNVNNFGNGLGQTQSTGVACVNVIPGMGPDCMATLGIDPFVFFDPRVRSNPMHLMYVWFGNGYGNNIADYPMANDSTLSASPGASIQALAYQVNSKNKINGIWMNGSVGAEGTGCNGANCGGVAEGPTVFYKDGRYYFVFSRNAFDSASYGLFYRMTNRNQPYSSLFMRNWNDQNILERPLVTSADRSRVRGIGFGRGRVFEGPTIPGRPTQYYVITHMKEENSYNRIPFFKEVTFNKDGTMEPMSNSSNADLKHSMMWFRVPRARLHL